MSLTVGMPSSGQAGGWWGGWALGCAVRSNASWVMVIWGPSPKGPFTPGESERESENFLLCLKFFL